MDQTGKPHKAVSIKEVQGLGTPWCGYYCIDVASRLSAGETFTHILHSYSNQPKQNDKAMGVRAKQLYSQMSIQK